MRIFFDLEFTGLHQNTTLISIGCVAEDGAEFYAECNDYDESQVDDWLRENVIAHLQWTRQGRPLTPDVSSPGVMKDGRFVVWCSSVSIGYSLTNWLNRYDSIEMWGDCLAYDWVLFCDLFGGALNIPECVYCIPFDLATLFKLKGIDPDVSREEYAGLSGGSKHNALFDAQAIKACYERAIA